MLRIKVIQNLINIFETYRCKYSVENSDGYMTLVICDNVFFVFNQTDMCIDGDKLEYETLNMSVESEDNVIHITFDDDVSELIEVNIYDRRG